MKTEHDALIFLSKITRYSGTYSFLVNPGHFVMFSVITNIYNKKTKGPTLMEFFHSHRKTEKVLFF
jgi:hypothetical protein